MPPTSCQTLVNDAVTYNFNGEKSLSKLKGNFMSFLSFSIVAIFIYIVYRVFMSGKARRAVVFCTTCGHEGQGKSTTRGSIFIEIILWLCFIIPGIIYSIWRISSRHNTCVSCGSSSLVPKDSPVAIATKRNLNS
ncbi:MAG: YqaE/Pmp3 family membrane protein [Burkholderiaceae bacterium]|nr:YqaE/Pmp3 family membrane protein [Burkholderiaceae bacterium]